jgi:ribonuclease HI
MPTYTLYTDGGADPNPGPGGWGAVLIDDSTGEIRELSGADPKTTNNRMELTAALRGLESLPASSRVVVFTDSKYLQKGVTEWLAGWIARGWKRKTGELQNEDLWRALAEVIAERAVTWKWLKGHAGHKHNERADQLATRATRQGQGGAVGPAEAGPEPAEAEVFLRVAGGPGGGVWAALVRHEMGERTLSGRVAGSANALDVAGAAAALESLPEGITVNVWSGSDYLRNGAREWLPAWRRRGWTTAAGEPVQNRAGWERLERALAKREVRWPKIRPGDGAEEFKRVTSALARARAGQAPRED